MNAREGEQEQFRVYREAVARNTFEGKLHKPEMPVNQVNHQANIQILHGRWHGTVYEEGKPRITQTRQRRRLRGSV